MKFAREEADEAARRVEDCSEDERLAQAAGECRHARVFHRDFYIYWLELFIGNN